MKWLKALGFFLMWWIVVGNAMALIVALLAGSAVSDPLTDDGITVEKLMIVVAFLFGIIHAIGYLARATLKERAAGSTTKPLTSRRSEELSSLFRICNALSELLPLTNPEVVTSGGKRMVRFEAMPNCFELIALYDNAVWTNFAVTGDAAGRVDESSEVTPITSRNDLEGVMMHMLTKVANMWRLFAESEDIVPAQRTLAKAHLEALDARLKEGPPPAV